MTFRTPESGRGRAFDWSLWVASVCPLWALVVFTWVVLGQLRDEVQEVARYYGVYVGKEVLKTALARVASAAELAQREGHVGRKGVVSEEACGRVSRLSGLEQYLLLLDRNDLDPLCPGAAGQGTAASALADEGFKQAFSRVVRQMDRQQASEGVFSPGPGRRSDAAGSPEKWFVFLEPAGREILCSLLVPERDLDRTGGSLEEALSVLWRRRERRSLLLSAGFGLLISAVIALIARNGRLESAPTEPGGAHDRHTKAPDPLGRP